MTQHRTHTPLHELDPSTLVDYFRLDAARKLDPEQRAAMGQYFTPQPVARLMATMFQLRSRDLHLLDPGAGVGSLTAAFVAAICARRTDRPASLTVTAYEVDPGLIDYLTETLQACRLACRQAGIRFVATVRREDFVRSGVSLIRHEHGRQSSEAFNCVIMNPPYRKLHSDSDARRLLRTYGENGWATRLAVYLTEFRGLAKRYAKEREMQRISVTLAPGKAITLSPGGQNVLVKLIVEELCSRFTPHGQLLYVGDTDKKWAYFEKDALAALGVVIEAHGKMPDVVVYYSAKDWLILVEAVTSHGPVNPKRHQELKELFKGSQVGLVFVTAFMSRKEMIKYLNDISWETEVWVAESPAHMIHFNGERFLGPYS